MSSERSAVVSIGEAQSREGALSRQRDLSREGAEAVSDDAPSEGFQIVDCDRGPNGPESLPGLVANAAAGRPEIAFDSRRLREARAVGVTARLGRAGDRDDCGIDTGTPRVAALT